MGFTLPPRLPGERCALTAPFHPYPPVLHASKISKKWRAVYFLWHFPWIHIPQALPGTLALWSPDFPLYLEQIPHNEDSPDIATARSTLAGDSLNHFNSKLQVNITKRPIHFDPPRLDSAFFQGMSSFILRKLRGQRFSCGKRPLKDTARNGPRFPPRVRSTDARGDGMAD